MIEYALYEYVRVMLMRENCSLRHPLTEELIIQLVGTFGFDTLKSSNLIERVDSYGNYILCCEC